MHEVGRWIGLLVCGLFVMYVLRKIGWTLSRIVFYPFPWFISIPLLFLWGTGIAWGFRHVILLIHPGWVLGTIGFGMAAYVAVPNYGLVAESTIPARMQPMHTIISSLPWLVFIAFSIVLAFTLKGA